jgi:hypothetical protein
MGWPTIRARVTQVDTALPAGEGLSLADLPLKSHERVFFERVPLPDDARPEITLSDPWDYAVLAEAVEAWGFRAIQSQGEPLDREQTALHWLETEYRPVVAMLREAGLVRSGTETDAYLSVAAERYRLLRTHDWSDEVLQRVIEGRGRRHHWRG